MAQCSTIINYGAHFQKKHARCTPTRQDDAKEIDAPSPNMPMSLHRRGAGATKHNDHSAFCVMREKRTPPPLFFLSSSLLPSLLLFFFFSDARPVAPLSAAQCFKNAIARTASLSRRAPLPCFHAMKVTDEANRQEIMNIHHHVITTACAKAAESDTGAPAAANEC